MDEQGNEAMDLEEEVDPYNLGTLMALSQYRAYQTHSPVEAMEELDVKMEELAEELAGEVTSDRKYNVYFDKQKAGFFYFNRIKLWKTAPSIRKAQVEVRIAQKWAKRLTWNIYEKQTNMERNTKAMYI